MYNQRNVQKFLLNIWYVTIMFQCSEILLSSSLQNQHKQQHVRVHNVTTNGSQLRRYSSSTFIFFWQLFITIDVSTLSKMWGLSTQIYIIDYMALRGLSWHLLMVLGSWLGQAACQPSVDKTVQHQTATKEHQAGEITRALVDVLCWTEWTLIRYIIHILYIPLNMFLISTFLNFLVWKKERKNGIEYYLNTISINQIIIIFYFSMSHQMLETSLSLQSLYFESWRDLQMIDDH